MATIRVRAGQGREVPLPASISSGTGGAKKRLTEADGEIEVDNANPYVQSCLRSEDFVLVESKPSAPPPAQPKTKES